MTVFLADTSLRIAEVATFLILGGVAWLFLRMGRRAIPSRWGRVTLYVLTGVCLTGAIVYVAVGVSFSSHFP